MTTPLVNVTVLTGTTETEGQAKSWFVSLYNFLVGLLGADGTAATALKTLMAPFSSTMSKTAAYTVVAADQGKVIKCSGTWTLSFSAAATLGDGFNVTVINTGAGTITLDPNLAELIDGAATITLAAGLSATISCDGAEFRSLGKGGVSSVNGANGAITAAQIAAAAAAGYGYTPANGANYVGKDNGGGTIGAYASAIFGAQSAVGLTYPNPFGVGAGTWRCTACSSAIYLTDSGGYGVAVYTSSFQRIA
ncbi:MAG: hypothetical protein PHY45_11635 [Rhodocyclaceae bacterium]|nr:hypothetical protein [Rhodocyclaceae bacterium]